MFRQIIKRDVLRSHVDKSVKCPVDQFAAADFNIAENGHPMSDIEVIFRTESEELRRSLLSRLDVQEVKRDDRTDEEKIRDIVPRYIQTPAEVARFVEIFHEMYPATQPVTIDDSVESAESDEPSDSAEK